MKTTYVAATLALIVHGIALSAIPAPTDEKKSAAENAVPAQDSLAALRRLRATNAAQLTDQPSLLLRALTCPRTVEPWKPQVADERPRGEAAVRAYASAAPAIVVVRTRYGHGTGFMVDKEGSIVTNDHVIEWADISVDRHARTAFIHVGTLRDGWMELQGEGMLAEVYKSDPTRDLALLRLVRQGSEPPPTIPYLELASKTAGPGEDCVGIGHPAAGQLWTVRSGEIANQGMWPAEITDVVIERLAASDADRDQIDQLLSQAPQRRVLISTCPLNPGDSGGPLLNANSQVIGVSFAVPQNDPEQGIHLDKFSYHIHLDELKAFLQDVPQKPEIYAPPFAPPAVFVDVIDATEDGVPDSVLYLLSQDEPPAGIAVDVDQDSRLEEGDDSPRRLPDDIEFGYQNQPIVRAFYDTDNGGRFNLVLTDMDADGQADVELRLRDRAWVSGPPATEALVSSAHFESEELRKAFAEFPFVDE